LGFGAERVDEAARINADGIEGSHEHVVFTTEMPELKTSQDGTADTNVRLIGPLRGKMGRRGCRCRT